MYDVSDQTPQEAPRFVLPVPLSEPVGAGDVVKKVTEALGIRPCSKCEQRRRRLNRALAFGRRKRA